MLNHTAKMLVWDIESSSIDILHRQYDLTVNTKRFRPEEIVRDWNIFSIAWKLIGRDKVSCVSVSSKNPTNDLEVVKMFHSVLMGAINAEMDAVVVVGYTKEGTEYFASSTGNHETTNWLMDVAKMRLMKDYVSDEEE